MSETDIMRENERKRETKRRRGRKDEGAADERR